MRHFCILQLHFFLLASLADYLLPSTFKAVFEEMLAVEPFSQNFYS